MKRMGLFAAIVVSFGMAGRIGAIEPGAKYAILVGVQDYENRPFSALKYSDNDVTELGKKLKAGGFLVTQMSDAAGAREARFKPTRENILFQLDRVLNRCAKRDLVLIALSGHGVQPEGGKDNFFCPCDARVQDPKTMISLAGLYDRLERSPAEVKLLLVDACRDDPATGKGIGNIKGISSVPLPPQGMGVLLSCSPGEQAYEHRSLKHGVFFHYLLEGLDGRAKNEDGEITFGQLAEYVQRRVAREVPKLIGDGAKQSPNLIANISGESPLLLKQAAKAAVGGDATAAPAPVATDGKPTAKEIVGNWEVKGSSFHIKADRSIVFSLNPVYLKGTYTCDKGVLDVRFAEIGWTWQAAASWSDAEKKSELHLKVLKTNLPNVEAGSLVAWQRSNKAEPPAPPTRKELVGSWAGAGVTYTLNADFTFFVQFNGGQMRGRYAYCGNVMVLSFADNNWVSMGLMGWADPTTKDTLRATMLGTTVPGGDPPGTQNDFKPVK